MIRRLARTTRVYITDHQGLVGSAVWRHLRSRGFTELVGAPSSDLDLRDDRAVDGFFAAHRPEVVVLAGGRVGGGGADGTGPAQFLADRLRIQVNVLEAAHRVHVRRLVFLGSPDVYPAFAPQPIPERALLTGIPEPTNDAYALAEIAGIVHVRAMRREHGHAWISVIPSTLYGSGDSIQLVDGQIVPTMIRRFWEAAGGAGPAVLAGTGSPRRELLHVDDLAAACLFLLENYDGDEHVNVGTGTDVSMAELAQLVAHVVGYDGPIAWDATKADGVPRRLLDVSKLTTLGWRPRIGLREGVEGAYACFLEQHGAVRGLA
jgi:GDP-L-fucose synthase